MGSRLAVFAIMIGVACTVFAVESAVRPRMDPQLVVRAISSYQDSAWRTRRNEILERSVLTCAQRGPCFLESYVPDNLSRVRKLVLCRDPGIADDSCLNLAIPEGYRLVQVRQRLRSVP